YRNIQLKTINVMLTNAFNFHALQDMVKSGLMITSVERDGKKVTDLTTMRSGDRLTIIGTPRALQKILPEIGYEIAEGQTTDISFLTIGIVLGVLLGSIVVKAFNIPITL
ncbi:aspartate-alanine antiporter, partial [Lactobacillus delbrueckii subsp. bulgaricus]|nr:aspartate-alanine antiporter [Lactobacillus delbrueckii subsp. bulgaricus]